MFDKTILRVAYPNGHVWLENNSSNVDALNLKLGDSIVAKIEIAKSVVLDDVLTVDCIASIDEKLVGAESALSALLKALIGRISYSGPQKHVEIFVSVKPNENLKVENAQKILQNFDFEILEGGKARLYLNQENIQPLSDIKKSLSALQKEAVPVGRGFVIDAERFSDKSLELLMDEYNDLAWGRTSWAMHSSLAEDEIEIIRRLCHKSDFVLEIGAGSGRITKELASVCGSLVATDYISDIVDGLKNTFKETSYSNVTFKVDNILKTQLPKSTFTKVFFLENGLGGILRSTQRLEAVENMTHLLKPGGLLVLGLRSLGEFSGDHVMPASQDNTFYGIYHTFSPAEIHSFESSNLKLKEIISGGARPAGGRQLFAIFEKL